MTMRRVLIILGAVLVVMTAALALWRKTASKSQPVTMVGDRLFDAVFAKIRSSLVDPLDDEDLYRRAALGLIGELDDPYAFLQLPGQPRPIPTDEPLSQGIFLDRRDGRAIVVSTIPDSPADQAGLRPGDILVGIDTTAISGGRLETAARLLEGKPGSTVTLRLRREGAPISVDLHRGTSVDPPAIRVADLGSGIASIRITRISAVVADTLRSTIERFQHAGGKSIVLDLRGSTEGGSDLEAGASVADLFLNRGTVLAVSKMRRASGNRDLTDTSPSPFSEMPVAVLIDRGTAGAAEAIAGALQDHDRAIVLGTASYGRGATWSSYSLGNGATLTLTTALWMTPNGRQIQRLSETSDGNTPADTTRPSVKSDRGRVLLGGGGIVPDRQFAEANGDAVLAEARRILLRATTPENVFASVGLR